MPLFRCPVCRTSSAASLTHDPGSWECMQIEDERREAHSDWEPEA